jgi:hypothetical protein
VVLAEAVEVDVLDEHHLVVGHLEERVVEDRVRILRVALGEEAQRLRHPLGGALQAVARGVLAELLEQRVDELV